MKPVFLQFDSISVLAGFSKGVNDRGYVIVIKDLTLQIRLTDAELQVALRQYCARLLPVNRAAA
jgi:hypothetical protein